MWRGRGPAWRIGVVLVTVALLVAGLVVAALLTDVEGELRAGRDVSASASPPPSPGLVAAG
ncbi:D-alanyl-D-alanine carboxypeptidase/D-alanyl-D-alanine-endopeptidase, partial [Dietzia cercidiphylli]|nr:D-alanyl-D-alanine carboxypeptidase/D-alanyl-D-alanine-endopeptidase [Dietzia cercidiphylli]